MFVDGNFSWSQLINETRKRLVCNYYSDIELEQSAIDSFYNLTSPTGYGAGFRLGSESTFNSNPAPDLHKFKVTYESEPLLSNAYPGFFMIPRDGVYEITCQTDIHEVSSATQIIQLSFVKNGILGTDSLNGGPFDRYTASGSLLAHQHAVLNPNAHQILSLNCVHKFSAGDHFSIFLSAVNGFKLTSIVYSLF